MPALPSSLALTSILDGSAIIASDHRNNYSAVQTAVNGLITDFTGGGAGQVLTSLSASSVGYVSGVVADGNGLTLSAFLTILSGANLDITSGAITPTASYHTMITTGGTTLSTVNASTNGRLMFLRNGTAGNVTIGAGGNISVRAATLSAGFIAGFLFDSNTGKWVQLF